MTLALPIIESCNGCGACCREQESPPGYVLFLLGEGDGWPDEADAERFNSLPPEALQSLKDHHARIMSGERRPNQACIWFEPATKGCRFYEHRPQICRELEVGSEGCRNWRKEYNVFPY